ncbi:uncharacterized protein LOC125106834 [Lutra lutra]|uniref:uncharacterized protein LOC125106834 n=1 Tax=Lutra lutra TaxID=9657 RepID=UPI001FD60CC2|nr:uncharacterized protein LOC125106834 [Lutra lutra]
MNQETVKKPTQGRFSLLPVCRRNFCTILEFRPTDCAELSTPGVERKETADLASPPTLWVALQLPGALEAPPPSVPGSRPAGGPFPTTPLTRGVGERVQRFKAPASFHFQFFSSQTQAAECPKGFSSSSLVPEAQAAQVLSAPRRALAATARPGGPLSRAHARRRARGSNPPPTLAAARRPPRQDGGHRCSRSASGPLKCQRQPACMYFKSAEFKLSTDLKLFTFFHTNVESCSVCLFPVGVNIHSRGVT